MKKLMTVAAGALFALTAFAQSPDWAKIASTPHPRLFVDDNEMKEIRKEVRANKNRFVCAIHDVMIGQTENVDPEKNKRLNFVPDGVKNPLENAREFMKVALASSYAYRETGDKAYVTDLLPAIEFYCDNFDRWMEETPIAAFIIDAEFAFGLAVAYDWMYKALPAGTKEKMLDQIKKRMLEHPWKESIGNNRSQVCNAAWFACAVAVAEHLDLSDMPKKFNDRLDNLKKSMERIYSIDGATNETPSYWSYGNMFQALAMMVFDCAFGSDYGMCAVPGFNKTLDYHLFTIGNHGEYFTYGDCGVNAGGSPAVWYYAWKFNRPDAVWYEIEKIKENPYKGDRSALIALIYAHRLGENLSDKRPESCFYATGGETPIVIARSGWTKDDAYLGIKGGTPMSSHTHLDVGMICYEAYGAKWSADFPHKAYQRYRNIVKKLGFTGSWKDPKHPNWVLFHMNNKQHSTLTVNDHTVNVKGKAEFLETYNTPEKRGGTLDMTSLYDEDLSLCKRTAVLLPDSSLKVTDEVTAKGAAEVRWTFITTAKVSIKDDCIVLTKNGASVTLKTNAPGAKYQSWPEDPTAYDTITSKYEKGLGMDGYHICGFTFNVPAGQHCEFSTTIAK